MAKSTYVVLKLKDEFTKPLYKAKEGTKAFEKECELARKSVARMTDNGMSKLTSFGVKAAKITAGIAAGFASIALAKGWSRMTQIDNAKVKLEAIGNTAEDVQKIMDNALASVKGTAYGMDAAATTAASAVAAGIKPGKSLERYLTTVADAAAVAGVEMDEMGSIFNKVATRGSANNEVLTQLSEKGVPIYQYLAKEIGTTADKVFKMATDGEISLKTFQNAVKKNIGGAAKEIGSKTITGAISNLKASVSRIGANFIGSADDSGSFAGKVLPLLNQATEALGKLEEKAKDWGAKFGEKIGSAIEWISENFDTIKNVVKAAIPVIAGFYTTLFAYNGIMKLKKGLLDLNLNIRNIIKAGGLIRGVLAANPILAVAVAIGILVAAFTTLYKRSEKFRNAMNELWKTLKKAAVVVAPAFAGFAATLALYKGVMMLKSGLLGVVMIFKKIIAFKKGISTLSLAFKAIFVANPITLVAIAIGVLVAVFVQLYKRSEKFRNAVNALWEILKKVASFITDKIVSAFEKMKSTIKSTIKVVSSIIDKLKGLFDFGGKSVNVNVNENTNGSTKKTTKGKHKALGTTYFAGGLTGFNEIGPEEAVLPSGTRIIPADKVGQGMGNKSVTVNLTVQGNVIGNKAYMEETGSYIANQIMVAMGNI